MFSGGHLGTLPGIDIAYILDGAAYHTQLDTVDRIRKGTVQVQCCRGLPLGSCHRNFRIL